MKKNGTPLKKTPKNLAVDNFMLRLKRLLQQEAGASRDSDEEEENYAEEGG
jgi:hypothetical protein